MKLLFIVIMLFILTVFCSAQEIKQNADAKQMLQKSAEACRNIKTIEFTEEQFHINHSNQGPFLTARVRQGKASVPEAGFTPGKFIVEGRLTTSDKEFPSFAFSYDGVSFRILDESEKVIQVIKSPTAYIGGQVLAETGGAMVGMPPYTQEKPFQLFLDTGEKFTYKGIQNINGEECDVISITRTIDHPALGKQTLISDWFLSRRDHLPRGNELGSVRKIIKILKINDEKIPINFFIPIKNNYSEKLITGKESRGKGLLTVGTTAPDWKLLDPQGKPHSISDYRGKIMVLDFWGTWCVPCWKTMPVIQSLHEKYKDRGVVFFGISIADQEGDPVGFMKRKGYTYNLLLNGDEISELYKAVQLPTLYVIDAAGRIIHAEYGFRENAKEELTAIIERALINRSN